MLLRGIISCSILFSINASEIFKNIASKELRSSSKAPQNSLFLPHIPTAIPPTNQRLLKRSNIPLKRNDGESFLPALIQKPAPSSPGQTKPSLINYNKDLNCTYRIIKDTKRTLDLAAHHPAAAQIPQEKPGFTNLWVNLGDLLLDACRRGDLKTLEAALFLGKERGLTVNTSSHNGRCPLSEASTEECTQFLLDQEAHLYEQNYTATRIHLSRLLLDLQNEQVSPLKENKIKTVSAIIKLLIKNFDKAEKKKLHNYWKLAIRHYKKNYGELNYKDELPGHSTFFDLIKTLVPLS